MNPTHRHNLRNRRRARRSAFSLIELLLVVVILAILAAVVVPKLTGRSEQARVSAARTGLSSLRTALNNFEIDNGRYPGTEDGLRALVAAPAGTAETWRGPYVEGGAVPIDPWGQAYVYRFPGSGGTGAYDLLSTGPDRREGGGDDIDLNAAAGGTPAAR